MGTRIRLKSTADLSHLDPSIVPIAKALQTYGAIVADNGSAWYISGEPDARWDNDALATLANIHGSDFEVVVEAGQQVAPEQLPGPQRPVPRHLLRRCGFATRLSGGVLRRLAPPQPGDVGRTPLRHKCLT